MGSLASGEDSECREVWGRLRDVLSAAMEDFPDAGTKFFKANPRLRVIRIRESRSPGLWRFRVIDPLVDWLPMSTQVSR